MMELYLLWILYQQNDKCYINKCYKNFFQSLFWVFHACDSHTNEAALFQNVFKLCIFLPKFSNILPFFALFLLFSEKSCACPYFLEQALSSLNCHSKKVRHCYIFDTVLLAIILLLIITIICYHYAKQKSIDALTI